MRLRKNHHKHTVEARLDYVGERFAAWMRIVEDPRAAHTLRERIELIGVAVRSALYRKNITEDDVEVIYSLVEWFDKRYLNYDPRG